MIKNSVRLPTVYNLIELDQVDSTNKVAKVYADKGEDVYPDGTIIWAKEQTEGRGRRGRTWHSPPGNLYISLILRPEIPLKRAGEFGFIASLALSDSLGTLSPAGHEIFCKWPNDILLNDKKVAGLLMESHTHPTLGGEHLDWLVLGIGVNIISHPEDTDFPATSLRFEQWSSTVEEALTGFSKSFLNWTNRWLNEGFEPVRKNWLWRAKGKGEPITVRLPNETISGRFIDLNEYGALVLETETGIETIHSGDVFFGQDR